MTRAADSSLGVDRNRRVHAEDRYVEVVRYDRAGKWYIEPLDKAKKRECVSVNSAARRASVCPMWGGKINFGLPGGEAFDRKVRALADYKVIA